MQPSAPPSPPRALALLIATLTVPAVTAHGQSCSAGPPTQLGTVEPLTDPCPNGTAGLSRTTCHFLRIRCTGIPSADVQVRVMEPQPGSGLRGTVVLGVGGGGVGFYIDREGGRPLIEALLARGFRVVDRSWLTSWFGDAVSVRKQSCRYATMLTWVHDNVHTAGAFCATGNSGGSAELCYALTTWGRGDILDVAVPTGGPPMARLDLLCQNPITPQWNNLCASVIPPNVMEVQPACTTNPNNPVCTNCAPGATPQDLRADSILHPGAVLDYPRTRVHMVIGAADDTSAVPNALLFHNAVTSEKVLEFVPGTPHWTATTRLGQQAIVRAILGGAACHTAPATLATPAWPSVGGTFTMHVHGPPGGAFGVFLAFDTALVPLGNLGWAFLGTPLFTVGVGVLDPVSGLGPLSVPVPPDPSLAGTRFYDQAIAESCLTNLLRAEIVP